MAENDSLEERNLAAPRVMVQFGANQCLHADEHSIGRSAKSVCRCNMDGALILWTDSVDDAESLYGAVRSAIGDFILQQPASRS